MTTKVCKHCGVEGIRVATCDSYRAPHLCPNDHITHSRPDLFCQVCGKSLISGVCPACTKLAESPEYKAYHAAVVEEAVKFMGLRGEQYRLYFSGCEYFEGFISKVAPRDEAWEQATAGS